MAKAFILLLTLLSILSCTNSPSPKEETDGPLADIEIEYAQNFKLFKISNGFELQIIDPNTQKVEKKFTFDSKKQRKIISLTATLNGMLSILHSTDVLVGISDISYVFDAKIKSRFEQELIIEYGDETTYSIEKMIANDANTVLYSGFGDEFPNEKKLKKLGMEIIPIYDWRENHPLGKAEWIKVVGAIVGKEKEATSYFNKMKEEYFTVKALIPENIHRPSAISGNLIGDVWYTPAADTYAAQMLMDAGADYRYKDRQGTISLEFSIESILSDNEETEFWINPGTDTKAKIDRINPHAKYLKAYKNIYCYSTNMNKYWERAAAEPHHVLSDLIHVFHPEIKQIRTFYYYKKISD